MKFGNREEDVRTYRVEPLEEGEHLVSHNNFDVPITIDGRNMICIHVDQATGKLENAWLYIMHDNRTIKNWRGVIEIYLNPNLINDPILMVQPDLFGRELSLEYLDQKPSVLNFADFLDGLTV